MGCWGHGAKLLRMSEDYAKLVIAIKRLSLVESYESKFYVKMKIGTISFQTPKRPLADPWGDTFEYRINLHAHLFYTLQVDVYEYRRLLSPPHLGRAEIRLAKLDSMPPSFTQYIIMHLPLLIESRIFSLNHRTNCYLHLHELNLKDVPEEKSLGSIELQIDYALSSGAPTATRFSLLPNISAVSILRSKSASPMIMIQRTDKDLDLHTPRIFPPAVMPESTDVKVVTQTDVISLFKKFLGYVMSNEEYFALKNFLDLAIAWGQGVEVSGLTLFLAFMTIQKYFKTLPMTFGNNIVLKKSDLELPRILYKYSMATLGWRGLNFFGKGQGYIVDSMRSKADLNSVMKYLNLSDSDLLIFELGDNRVFRPNFFVSIDRGLSAIILSIRGTMSLSDGITDFACEYQKYRGGMVHSGFFEAARWFLDNICHQLLIFCKEYETENLYICGHSLGASVSALTTILMTDTLKKDNTWPIGPNGKPLNIKCYGYGMAPVISRNMCESYLDYIEVFINGDDLVPRMSYGSYIDFQILIVYAAEICAHKGTLTDEVVAKLTHCREALCKDPQMNLKLYVPGRIHHMLKFRAPSNQKYVVIDTVQCDRFADFFVSRKMLSHHMPGKYEETLEQAYLELLQDEIVRSETPSGTTSFQETVNIMKDAIKSPIYADWNDSEASSINSFTKSAATQEPAH